MAMEVFAGRGTRGEFVAFYRNSMRLNTRVRRLFPEGKTGLELLHDKETGAFAIRPIAGKKTYVPYTFSCTGFAEMAGLKKGKRYPVRWNGEMFAYTPEATT